MPSPPHSYGVGIMFSGCPVGLFVRPFVWTDIVSAMCHERLE